MDIEDFTTLFAQYPTHPENFYCIFSSILGGCSRSNKMTVICDNHCRSLFAFELVDQTLVSTYGSKKITYMTPTYINDGMFLPFPYDYVNNEFCFRPDVNSISSFIQSIPNVKQNSPRLMMVFAQLFGSNTYTNELCTIQPWIILSQNPSFQKALQSRYNQCSIGAIVGNEVVDIPVTKLPIFYQFILYYVEFSNHTNVNNTPGSNLALKVNMILNVDEKCIKFINNDRIDPINIKTPTNNISSPIVINGTQNGTHSSQFFVRMIADVGSLVQKVRSC